MAIIPPYRLQLLAIALCQADAGTDDPCENAVVGADRCLSLEKLSATQACRTELELCLNSSLAPGCAQQLSVVLGLHNAGEAVQWWAQGARVQAVYACGLRRGA
eukprot:COSAG05_NODE_12832_length_452_cov_1.113314_1_plen_103_part_10